MYVIHPLKVASMGTDYRITDKIELLEGSCQVQFCIETHNVQLLDDGASIAYSQYMTSAQLREAIIRQIEVLSYISDDPEEVLKRFNVDYGQNQ